jgi:adenylate cyclase
MKQPVERRLAAILAADVAGYSRMMGQDEAGTAQALREHRAAADPLIAEHGGRIVKTTGDGVLIEFGSVVGAVQCAIALQKLAAERNADSPANRRMEWRIGIHLGDVLVEGDDILGDGVNIAARLEGIAEPGGTCISDDAFRQVRGKVEAEFADMGEQSLKNIARPLRVYHIGPSPATEQPTTSPTALLLPDKPSIAVMPFTNMSGDPEQEYFVDGIVEDIITGLSRIKWLRVIARNSTFTYKGRAVDVKQAGRELGVRYVLEGSLRKAGSRVRVTAQLIAAASGTHVWAERYDRSLDDIFELQDEITLSVVGAIEPSLLHAEIERAKRKRPDNLDAYDLYLRALPHARVYMPSEADQALPLLHRSLSLQPDYPAAHAAAALCHEVRYMRGGMQEADKEAALSHARAAIEGGADDAETLATAGFVIGLVAHDYDTAMNAIDRALLINSTSAYALGWGANILGHAGRAEQGVEYAERALRLSPLDPGIGHQYGGLGIAYCAARNWQGVVAACGKAIQAMPRFSLSYFLQAAALSELGRVTEATSVARRGLELEPGFTVSSFVRAHTGRAEIWEPIGDALRRLDLPE